MSPIVQPRQDLARRLEAIRRERAEIARPPVRFDLKDSWKRELDEWKARHPEKERRHAELVEEEGALERCLEELAQRERLEARLLDRLKAAGAGERSARHALEPEDRPALRVVREWLEAEPRSWALVLCGTTGTGKTVAGVWAMAESLRRGETVASRAPPEIGRMPLFRSARDRDEFKHLSTVGLLVVDDLGAYSLTDNGRSLLLELLNARYEAAAQTIITTNAAGAQLQRELTERTLDRFRDGGRVVDLSGKSMRGRA